MGMEREDKKILIISLKTITVSFQFFAKKNDSYFSTPSQEQIREWLLLFL